MEGTHDGRSLSPQEIHRELERYCGTSQYWRLTLGNMLCTDGVKAMADMCGAYWLLDTVQAHQSPSFVQKSGGMQVWTLTVKGSSGKLVCTDGNYNHLKTQKIEFTDFPLPSITLWVIDGVCLLPSEY